MARGRFDWLRKLAAILLVLGAVTGLMVGVGLATTGQLWGLVAVPLAAAAIWTATIITPEGGTTGYFDKNI